MTSVLEFLRQVDQALAAMANPGERLDLYHLGRSALVLHYGFSYATNDVDFVDVHDSQLQQQALGMFGKGKPAAMALGMYIQAVPPGLPPLPAGFKQRCTEVSGDWQVLRLWKLDLHDLAASKLKRFHTGDREDIQQLCDRGLLKSKPLRGALEQSFQFSLPGKDDEDDPGRVAAFRNLERVEQYLRGELPPGGAL